MSSVWVTTPISEIRYGVSVTAYTNLRELLANVQYMDNETKQRTFGTMKNEVLLIRMLNMPAVEKGDSIYLSKPAKGQPMTIDGEEQESYGPGPYVVVSVMPTRVNVKCGKNPTLITARSVADADV